MKIRSSFIYMYLGLLLYLPVCAFGRQQDFIFQPGIIIEKRISRSFSARLISQAFINQNGAELSGVFTEAAINYRLNNNISMSVSFRDGLQRNVRNFYDDRQLIGSSITYSKFRRKIGLTFRGRIQRVYYGDFETDNYHRYRDYFRFRSSIRYKFDYYLSAYVEGEIFKPLNNPRRKELDQARYTLGMMYTLNDHLRLEGFYQVMQLFDRTNSKTNYIFGINTTIRF